MTDFPLKFGTLMNEYRLKVKAPMRALVGPAGISLAHLWRLEREEVEPTWRQVCVLSYLLEIPLNRLFPQMPAGMKVVWQLSSEPFRPMKAAVWC